jgi:hypothetical protein
VKIGDDGYTPEYIREDILRYEHGRPATVVTPPSPLIDGEEAMNGARTMLGHGENAEPFVDQLGLDGQILRNPVVDGQGYEYAVPWTTSGEGSLTHSGRMIPPRPNREPIFHRSFSDSTRPPNSLVDGPVGPNTAATVTFESKHLSANRRAGLSQSLLDLPPRQPTVQEHLIALRPAEGRR